MRAGGGLHACCALALQLWGEWQHCRSCAGIGMLLPAGRAPGLQQSLTNLCRTATCAVAPHLGESSCIRFPGTCQGQQEDAAALLPAGLPSPCARIWTAWFASSPFSSSPCAKTKNSEREQGSRGEQTQPEETTFLGFHLGFLLALHGCRYWPEAVVRAVVPWCCSLRPGENSGGAPELSEDSQAGT